MSAKPAVISVIYFCFCISTSSAKETHPIKNPITGSEMHSLSEKSDIEGEPILDQESEMRIKEIQDARTENIKELLCNVADLNLPGSYFGSYQLRQILKDKLIFRSFEHQEAIVLPKREWRGDLDEGVYLIAGADFIGHVGNIRYRNAKGFNEELESWIILDKYIIDGKPLPKNIKADCPQAVEEPVPSLPFQMEIKSIKLIPSVN